MSLAGLFITGTDTGVGKTFVAAGIARRLVRRNVNVGLYKPAVSGADVNAAGQFVWQDVEQLWSALDGAFPKERICPQCFQAPLAPPVAAAAENRAVDAALLRTAVEWWRDRSELLIVEGAGGLLAPISDSDTVADVAADLGFPLIVVARLGLGTINHTLMTLEVARQRGLRVAGIVLNEPNMNLDDISRSTNAAELSRWTEKPILAVLPHQTTGDERSEAVFADVDWETLAGL